MSTKSTERQKCRFDKITATLTIFVMILVVIGIVIATTTTATTTATSPTTSTSTTTDPFTTTTSTCVIEWINDGICDDVNNLFLCGFDAGDCCMNEIVNTNCHKCICHIDGKRHPTTAPTTTTIPILPNSNGKVENSNSILLVYFIIRSCSISVSKFLILTGCSIDGSIDMCSHEEPRKKIEVIDVQNPLNSCSLPEEFPTRLFDAVGGLTKDGPLLCGGYNLDTDTPSNECFTFQNSKFIATHVRLRSERYWASAVVLPDGELWIHGGSAKLEKLSSSETVTMQGSKDGMEMEWMEEKTLLYDD